MSSDVKIYRLKDFIRKTESGDLSYDRIIEIVNEIAAIASFHSDHNVLLDFRETTVSIESMYEIMKIAMELSKITTLLRNKIANVIPSDTERIALAKKFEAALQLKGLQYKFFTDFENAIDWLSEKTDLTQPSR